MKPSAAQECSRRIGIAVDLSEESGHAVRWAVRHYLRAGDSVVLLHVRPTSALYGADWGPNSPEEEVEAGRAQELARPLAEAQVPFRVHMVRDHDLRERLCLEVERLGISALVVGASRRREGSSMIDYCLNHCVCPVVVVRYRPEEEEPVAVPAKIKTVVAEETNLPPVPEEDDHQGNLETVMIGK